MGSHPWFLFTGFFFLQVVINLVEMLNLDSEIFILFKDGILIMKFKSNQKKIRVFINVLHVNGLGLTLCVSENL
jgi:hypothetical protein